jgi:hypothetical protein
VVDARVHPYPPAGLCTCAAPPASDDAAGGISLRPLLLLACILSELQTPGHYQSQPKLLEFWPHLRNLEGEAKNKLI